MESLQNFLDYQNQRKLQLQSTVFEVPSSLKMKYSYDEIDTLSSVLQMGLILVLILVVTVNN